MSFKVPERFRVTTGPYASDKRYGNNGAFRIPDGTQVFNVIASDQEGWDHVSVSLQDRCPTWDEMCHIKALFWDASDCVVQYHPAAEDYVNCHATCLHLWRPTNAWLPTPPTYMVGPK